MNDPAPPTPSPGTAEPFEAWFQRWNPRARELARRVLGEEEAARDAAQAAFLKAWRRRSQCRSGEAAWPWFARIVLNVCRDRLRGERVRERAILGAAGRRDAPAEEDPVDAAMRDADVAHLARALGELPKELRRIVELKHLAELSFAEVALALELPVSTVKSRLGRALDLLRVRLKREAP